MDNGSVANILTYDVYKKIGFLDKDLSSTSGHLYGFTLVYVSIKGGLIRLPITLGDEPYTTTQVADFMVVDQQCTYNTIIGRPILKTMKVLTSIYHLSMIFPTPT